MLPDHPDDLRDVPVASGDEPLRQDIRELGHMVGDVLAEQAGRAFFQRVELLRTAAIHRREDGDGCEALATLLADTDAGIAEALARAFSTWFQAVNTAERVHAIRQRRAALAMRSRRAQGSLGAVLEDLNVRGVTAEELLDWIGRLDVEPVFTAHPTQAVRRSLLEKEQAIVQALVAGFDAGRTPLERERDSERVRTALTAGWQTAGASAIRPTVQDEFEHISFYLAEPLYRVLPTFYERLAHELERVYGIRDALPRIVRFGSWVGGDMDGNPNVGADTIAGTLQAQRLMVLERYRDGCQRLGRLLSQTDDRVEVSAGLRRRLQAYRDLLPAANATIRPRHQNMPYRCLLALMVARLDETMEGRACGYANAAEFVADVELIVDSMADHKGAHAGLGATRRLLWRARTFGFHLARLDIRQDSRVHDDVLAVLFGDADWRNLAVDERTRRLQPMAAGDATFPCADDEDGKRLAAVFAALTNTRRNYGVDATGPYIISMAHSVADVLAVLALARHGGFVADGAVPLDIAPLLETVEDLRHGAAMLRALLADPVYRAHLALRGDRQLIMVGYSDSMKDGGILAARWALQHAQAELLEVAREAGIGVTFFHGRGGSASRGGGHVDRALMASPRGAVAGCLRMTEQGEVIHRQYGIRALALDNLERTVGAALSASLRPRQPDPHEAGWIERMDALAARSREAYRALVTRSGFVDYFRAATPIDVIERMTIGSRPASRRSMHGVEDLRAIPWVFSWTQMRAIVPGWYGIGSALEHGVEVYGEEAMAHMVSQWPFLATVLDDVEMVLAKADMDIAEAFSRLSGDLHDVFYPLVRDEYVRTCDWICRLKRQDGLLAGDPRLAQSIRLRNPYIDPMSLLQVDLLRRWRAAGSADDDLLTALVACVNGIAQGLQNTG